MRDAFARDARRMIEDLFNDRQLISDDTPPLPCETVHHINEEILRDYFLHVKTVKRWKSKTIRQAAAAAKLFFV